MKDVLTFPVKDHGVVVAGDGHYWPDQAPSTAHKFLMWVLDVYEVSVLIINGDAFDAAGISTHPPQGWQNTPSLLRQLNTTKKRMAELREKAGQATCIYIFGNHEARFDKKLALKAGQFNGIPGMSLEEHFPDWICAERIDLVGKERCVVKHEMSGGANPLKSNLQKTGCHVVTGHHHCQNVLAHTNYEGTQYAVDAGMLGKINGPQFSYGEGNPVNWRSGFVMLPWHKGKMMPPVLATVMDEKNGSVWFDGSLHEG